MHAVRVHVAEEAKNGVVITVFRHSHVECLYVAADEPQKIRQIFSAQVRHRILEFAVEQQENALQVGDRADSRVQVVDGEQSEQMSETVVVQPIKFTIRNVFLWMDKEKNRIR